MVLPKFFKTINEQIIKTLTYNEPALVIGMCESGKNTIFREVIYLLEGFVNLKKPVLMVDVVGYPSEASTIILRDIANDKITELSIKDIKSYLAKYYFKTGVILLVNLGDLDEINKKILSILINTRNTLSSKFTFTIFGYINVLNQISEEPIFKELLLRKIIKLTPLQGDDLDSMIERDALRFEVNLSETQKEYIRANSGGNPGLIKSLVLQIIDNPKQEQPDLEDQSLVYRIDRVLEGLTANQLSVLAKISRHEEISNLDKDFRFLKNFGYIKIVGSKPEIFTKLLDPVLLSYRSDSNINNRLELILTKTELRLFNVFNEKKGIIISRDDIARVIWGENYHNVYSDYAIDRHISNLRKKLVTLNYPLNIQTLKGKGFLVK